MRITIPVSGPTKQDRSIQANSQRSINMYASIKTSGDSKSDLIMYSHPGPTEYANAGIGPYRCNAVKFQDKLWWVSGSELFSQDTSGNLTSVGTLLTSGSRCVLAAGRNYLMLVDGTYGYYTDGTTLTRITDVDFPGSPTHNDYMDGYFIVNDADTDDFYINTTIEDPTAWAALDFATANAHPDKTLALKVNSKDLYMFGEETTQIYFNSGNASFPFDAYPGALQVGIGAPHSCASSIYGMIWLGTNSEGEKAIVKSNGGSVEKISDEELTWQINKLSVTSDAIAWIRRQGGATFYEITFPAADRTFSVPLDSSFQPSELKSYNRNRFIGSGYGYLGNSAYVGSCVDGRIYKLDFDNYDDDGDPFIRKRVTRVIHRDGLGIVFRTLILDAESGVGLITGQGSDPQVMMRYSTDGGRTWSSELWRSLGAIGTPSTKPTWSNLGLGYDWVFEFACSDPVKFNIFNLFADIEMARS